jgi:hypothetical protein
MPVAFTKCYRGVERLKDRKEDIITYSERSQVSDNCKK